MLLYSQAGLLPFLCPVQVDEAGCRQQRDIKEDDFELLHATSHFDQCLQQHPLAGGQQELLRDEFLCMCVQVCNEVMCVPATRFYSLSCCVRV